jgi:hypothetical protein
MENFLNKYSILRNESLNQIKDKLKIIYRFELATTEEIESDDFGDTAWELPTNQLVNRHGYSDTFAITRVSLEDGILWFNGVNIGEDSEEYLFGENELEVGTLCEVADFIN